MGACDRDNIIPHNMLSERDYETDSEVETSDSENEDQLVIRDFAAPEQKSFQRVVPGLRQKRTYGVRNAAYNTSSHVESSQQHNAKLDEQLDDLRAIIPNATRSKERNSVVLDAYRYIAALQRQVEDLSSELLEDAMNASVEMQDAEKYEVVSSLLYHNDDLLQRLPIVEVAKQDAGRVLEVRIVCANRPGLLVDIMEALESRGLTIWQATIACHNEIVFEYLSVENEEPTERGKVADAEEETEEEEEEEEEEDSVKAMLVHAICK